MESLIKFVQEEFVAKKDFPEFAAGDTITLENLLVKKPELKKEDVSWILDSKTQKSSIHIELFFWQNSKEFNLINLKHDAIGIIDYFKK